MSGFQAVGAMLMYATLDPECLVIGLERMKGSENAENIKKTTEIALNEYDFDYSKIIVVLF